MSTSAPAAAPVSTEGVRGGVHVRERVIDKAVREASARVIGVPRGDVDVEVNEWGRGLAVRIASRLPVPSLEDTEQIRSGQPIIERVRNAQEALATEFARLTGREIRRVSFTVTGAIVPERKRVK